MMRFVESLRVIVRWIIPTVLSVLLLTIWLATERWDGKPYIQHLLILFVLLGLIFFADGLEVAYSVLRYKDTEQFGGLEARLIREMHDNENLVYEAREWLVTVIIVVITIMAEYKEIHLPLSERELPSSLHIKYLLSIQTKTLFSLLFTTLPVLWFAQGLSKRIARDCPQKFIGAGALVWSLVKKVGWITDALGLDFPTEIATKVLKKSDAFSDDLALRPSDHAYYVASFQRYGYALHELETRISVDPLGACTVNVRVLYYGIDNPSNVFGRRLTFGAPPRAAGHCVVTPAEVYIGPAMQEADPGGQAKRALLGELDFICSRGARGSRQQHQLFTQVPSNVSMSDVPDTQAANLMHYRIDTHGAVPAGSEAFAVLVEFTSYWEAGAFNVNSLDKDFFYMAFECPCYRYRLSIDMDPSCPGRIAEVVPEALCAKDPHWGERNRLQRALVYDPAAPLGLACELYYPFPGIQYRFDWTIS